MGRRPDRGSFYTGFDAVDITIGCATDRRLRVIGIEDPWTLGGVVTEHFTKAGGRQVYQCSWRTGRESVDGEPTLRLAGLGSVPWYDCLPASGRSAARAWGVEL